ncbi:MAG: ATP-dependent RecD-like DNA helicase [Deltaproteobacteria bacterium]|nr:MAG: ATP-dependent RecD-like DNA helicase [Deltaproteobacteria bacterium]
MSDAALHGSRGEVRLIDLGRQEGREGQEACVEGVVDRIRFASHDEEFQVLVVRTPSGRSQTVVARGGLFREGEQLRAAGRLKRHRSGDLQLDAERLERPVPATREGIEAYLGSGMIPGVGPTLAAQIVETFGSRTLEILDGSPERLIEVPGIGARRLENITSAWAEQHAVRSIMIFLQGHGISPRFAARIHRAYGAGAVPVVERDPYRLARDIRGIGFLSADRIARSVGIAPDDIRRRRAGLEHVLHEAGLGGHLYLPDPVLLEHAAALLGLAEEHLVAPLDDLVRETRIVRDPIEGQPDALYLRDTFLAEEDVARRVAALQGSTTRIPVPDAHDLEVLERGLPFSLAPGQREALRVLLGAPVGVLTGGPGTGKTTIVRALVGWVARCGARVELAAPTGRAARRLSESTDRPARTLHRLLEFDPARGGFQKGLDDPLDTDLVIVDEASMVDLFLMRALVRALAPGTALLLVGDVEQLPSVGAGDVLRDLIEAATLPVARLDRVFRQAETSRIVDAAHAIRQGMLPEPDTGARGEFFFIRTENSERAAERVVELVTERIPSAFGLSPRTDVQVLTPTHRGPLGTRALNEALGHALGGGASGPRFAVGDKVMQTRNNYTLETFNGDIGIVASLDPESGRVAVRFEDREVTYGPEHLDDLDLAWAVTVHKSQGSEFPAVVLVLSTQHYVMLQRNLVYTAVTRARQLLVVVGMERALRMAVDNIRSEPRFTRLSRRLSIRTAER